MLPKIVLSIVLLASSWSAGAELLEPEKREPIDELIQIFQTRQLSTLIAQNLTQTTMASLTKRYGQLDQAVSDIIFDEAKTLMYEQFILNGKLNDIFYSLYDEYYTAKQLRDLVKFYRSPTGKRVLEVGDQISRKSMQMAQAHAREILPDVQLRIKARLEKTLKQIEQANAKTDQSK